MNENSTYYEVIGVLILETKQEQDINQDEFSNVMKLGRRRKGQLQICKGLVKLTDLMDLFASSMDAYVRKASMKVVSPSSVLELDVSLEVVIFVAVDKASERIFAM